MAYEESVRNVTIPAGEDLTGDLHKFGVVNSSGQLVVAGTAQIIVDGIIAEEVDTIGYTTSMTVPDGGIAKVRAGGAFAVGALIATDASGQAVAHGSANGNIAMGRAIEAAAAAGDVVSIQFIYKGQANV